MMCSCWICWGDAYRKGLYGDWDDLVCLVCGHYKISLRFIKACQGNKFDVERMRDLFSRFEARGLTPIVHRNNAIFAEKKAHIEPTPTLVGWPKPFGQTQRKPIG
jgi:hypothetical protein